MTTYTATFADGKTIIRNSDRQYTAAWRATWTNPESGRVSSVEGFSASPEVAAKSAYIPSPWGCYGTNAQKAEARRKNAEYREAAGYRVEIVPATDI